MAIRGTVLWMGVLAVAWMLASPKVATRSIAVTIDDLPVATAVADLAWQRRITTDLVAALRRNRVPAIGFVNQRKVEVDGRVDPARVGLLRQWIDAGLELGNHTYSHPSLHRVLVSEFQADLLRGDSIVRALASERGRVPRYFRHPYLHTGRDSLTRAAVDSVLGATGYRVAPVTVDNGDYVYAAAYERLVRRGQPDSAATIADRYLDYMARVVDYFEHQSLRLFGREIPQVLLIHASALNAVTFDRLARRLLERGYSFVSIDAVLPDSAFRSPDRYFGPGGISWLHRWGLTEGKPTSFFEGEPAVPGWIEAIAGIQQ